ncbi:thymidylate kinase [Erwinia phage Ea35-70]|uniref:dTMP kinase n=7 Tax=Agricanvirus TaxID=1984776 RepID=W6ASI5_9CAUD|nr:thymidylate kinase [Erwinia phage Ea35-70]AHI60461.1 thymidylate kinase [Erwinia phage Ea35-70]QBP07418.1 putative thymidylate kinase [Erwinia phage Rebecca]
MSQVKTMTAEEIRKAMWVYDALSNSHRGLYVKAEGPDGSGKSTFVKLLTEWLQTQLGNSRAVMTREMGGTAQGRVFREMVLFPKETQELDLQTETLLCWADRVEGQKQVKAWLNAGIAVVQDRTYFSTYAYQGMLYGQSPLVSKIHSGLDIMNADIVFVLDVDPEDILARVGRREAKGNEDPTGNDRMDVMTDRQLKDLCYFYRGIEHQMPACANIKQSKVIHLDGRQTQEQLLQDAIVHLTRFLDEKEREANDLCRAIC